MPRTKKTKGRKQAGRRRPYKKAVTKYKSNWVLTGRHVITNEDTDLPLNPSTNRWGRVEMTDISIGDRIDQRNCNVIYVKYLRAVHSMRNLYASTRFIRFFLLRVKGNEVSPNTSFGDLLVDPVYVPGGPTGQDEDMTQRFNQNIYELIWQKNAILPGGSGNVPARRWDFHIPVKKFVSYGYNTPTPRKGALIYGWFVCEAAGNTPNATLVEGSYMVQSHYADACVQTVI